MLEGPGCDDSVLNEHADKDLSFVDGLSSENWEWDVYEGKRG